VESSVHQVPQDTVTLGADDLDLPEVAVVLEIALVPAVEALLTVAATVTWPEISI
jgi:hypothetical protein